MAFSYTIFLALVLLVPGFALWAGLRVGERKSVLSPAVDKPGSTTTLLTVIFGALIGHLSLAIIYALQSSWCECTSICIRTGFDPNVYRALLSTERSGPPSDWAIAVWFGSLLVPAIFTGWGAMKIAGHPSIGKTFGPLTFGWLYPIVEQTASDDDVIIAYVVTTLRHEGSSVGYEGIVEQISFDDNKAVSMLVLSTCDRFLVKMTYRDVIRVSTRHDPIPLIHLRADQIANLALEVFEGERPASLPTPSPQASSAPEASD